ncbi:MAG: methyltransferase domain-containing protein [Alphaproteobacteria bacterium]|nr:methyltransferase domain-containing protein [Alphaproteobacteria bacterium]
MPDKIQKIKAYWDAQGRQHGSDLRATMPDPLLKELELDALKEVLDPSKATLEAGCGNGFNLFALQKSFQASLCGFDYSEELIKAAIGHVAKEGYTDIDFSVGNILDDLSATGEFEQIFTDRCLINLSTHEEQCQAALNLASILSSGGLLALVECSKQSLDNLNRLRNAAGLSEIEVHWHNRYLDEDEFIAALSDEMIYVQTVAFSSLYYIASRVFNAALTSEGDSPDYMAEINKCARKLPSVGDCGPHKLFLFRKP